MYNCIEQFGLGQSSSINSSNKYLYVSLLLSTSKVQIHVKCGVGVEGHPATKTRSNTHGWITGWWRFWPKPQCTCNAMVTSQAQPSTNEGVLRSNSACSMLMSDDLRLPRRGIEPRPPRFRQVNSTARPLPIPLPPEGWTPMHCTTLK